MILSIAFLLIPIALHWWARDTRLVRLLCDTRTARILLGVGAVLLAIEGTWSVPLHSTPAFVAYALLLLLSLAMALLQGIRRKARIGFLLLHAGIFLIIWGALFGAPDVKRAKMVIGRGDAANFAVTDDRKVVPLPFNVALEDFTIDYYPDGKSPRQFTSHLLVAGEHLQVAVNEPANVQGWTLFQDSYDREAGRYTVLQLVRDPWLPVVYTGMALLAAGAVMLLFGRWKTRMVVPVALLLTALFTAISVAKINFGTLMPALRSWWFVPHVFLYMVAYSLMALSLLAWIAASIRRKEQWHTLSANLMRSSSALLIIGMLTGSVWARQAWGDYWAWDPKENWAAATWFFSLMHLHLRDRRGWRAIVYLVLSFLALQVTWYGIHYLPSAMHSLHTYMK